MKRDTPRNLYENHWTWFMKNWCHEVRFWLLSPEFSSNIYLYYSRFFEPFVWCDMCIAMKLLGVYIYFSLCFFSSSFDMHVMRIWDSLESWKKNCKLAFIRNVDGGQCDYSFTVVNCLMQCPSRHNCKSSRSLGDQRETISNAYSFGIWWAINSM